VRSGTAGAVARAAGLVAGLVPVLLLGGLGAVATQRWGFAAWGIVVAVVFAGFLRWGLVAGWNAWLLLGRVTLLFAAAAAFYGHLLERSGQGFDAGYKALLPGLYTPALAAPRNWYLVAVVASVVGALQVLIGHGATRRPPPPPRRLG